MALTLGDNFSYQGAKPLDGRLKYDTVAAMASMADNVLYDGCLAYCIETDKTYQWKSTNEIDTTLGRWREFSGSGTTVTVDDELSDISENSVQNKVIKSALDAKVDETVVGDLSDLHTTDKTDLVSAINEAAQTENQVISLADFEQLTPAEKNNGKAYFISDAYAEDRYIAYTGFTPVGTVISYYGETAPAHYLVCDGSVYNKADYPELWTHLSSLSNTTPYTVDGDNTKFKVPDLRGEFLRGSGTNGHENQGNGGNVGVHQDATVIPSMLREANAAAISIMCNDGQQISNVNPDLSIKVGSGNPQWAKISSTAATTGSDKDSYTTRPTNTSVLYCIAIKNIYIDARHNYSLEEQEVGTWIDGKTLYEKTFSTGLISCTNRDYTNIVSVGESNIDTVKEIECVMIPSSGDSISSTYVIGMIKYNKSANTLQYYDEYVSGSYKFEITIRYTKTTD